MPVISGRQGPLAETDMSKWATLIVLAGATSCVSPVAPPDMPPPAIASPVAPPASETQGEIEILVQGAVRKAGVYRFHKDEPCTMMYLLFKIGTLPQVIPSIRNAIIQRRNPGGTVTEIKVNIRELLDAGDPEKDVPLKNGDRVIIEERLWAI